MKKTFLCVLAVAGMLAAPSCIKNDEPVGIEEMRKGKAELLKAEALVQQAEAKVKEAEVKIKEALAAQEEATARQLAAVAELEELKVELAKASNEKEKARLEAEKAKIEQQMLVDAEKAKRKLLRAQAKTAEAEIEYQKALNELQAYLITTEKSAFADALSGVLKKLETSRNQIVGYQNQIAAATLQLYNAATDEKAWVRNQNCQIEEQKALVEVLNERLAYWSALAEANEVKWGPELEAAKAKVAEADAKLVELTAARDEKQEAYDEAQRVYWELQNQIYEPIELTYTAENSRMYGLLQSHFVNSGWSSDAETFMFTYNGTNESAMNMLQVDFGSEQAGLIAAMKHDLLISATDMANEEQRLAVLKEQAEEAAKVSAEDLKAFREALAAFEKGAAAYKFDWTKTNSKTLRDEVIAQVGKFYEELAKAEAEDAKYKPEAEELKAIAEVVADYVKVRGEFDGIFDTKVTVTVDEKEVEMPLSDYLVSDAKVIEAYVVGDKKADFEAIWNAEEVDFSSEKSVTAELAAASLKAYDIDGWLLHEITEADFTTGTWVEQGLVISYNFVTPIGQVYNANEGIVTIESVGGSFTSARYKAHVASLLESQIANQPAIEAVIATMEGRYAAVKAAYEEADKALKAQQEAVEAAGEACEEADSEYNKIYEARSLYAQTVSRIERYVDMGSGEFGYGKDGQQMIVEEMAAYVKELTHVVNMKSDNLERLQNTMRVYEETGWYNEEFRTKLVAEIEAHIESIKEQLENEQGNFDRLVAQKNQLLEQLKNE